MFIGGIGLLLLCITPWSKESQPGLQIDYVIDYRISPVELMIITIYFHHDHVRQNSSARLVRISAVHIKISEQFTGF